MPYSFLITRGVCFILFIQFIKSAVGDFGTKILLYACNSTDSPSGPALVQNFVVAMANLSTMVNENGFGEVGLGTGPGLGYALVQCFDDLNSTDCSLCFSELRSILPKCFPKIGGRVFFDGCFGRYENYNFFHQYVGSNDTTVCSSGNNASHPVEFLQTLKETVGRVQSVAPANGGFSMYTLANSDNTTVNALGQCWRNLGRELCSACLRAAASSIVSCSPALEGRSLYAGCYLRYSDRVFWYDKQTSASSGISKIAWISATVSLGGFLFITVFFIWLSRKRLGQLWKFYFKESHGMELPPSIALSKLNFKYNVLRKATDDFNSSNKLGQGSHGSVHKGVLPDGREVAVKRLFLNTSQWMDQFFNEVNLVSQVHHKNLAKLLGCSLDGPESLLVYEYYYNGSLDFFIFDADAGKLLDWKSRVDIIEGTAEGLCYLHEESEVRVVHRDIKASNILLDDSLKPRITDFGLARSFPQNQTHMTTELVGTLGYMAPEYIIHGHLSEKADVYSFGVLLLEIVTGQRCTAAAGVVTGESLLSKVWKEYARKSELKVKMKPVEIMDERIWEDSNEDEFWGMVHIGLLCTQAGAASRPPMSSVLEFIRRSGGNYREEVVPKEPPFMDVLVGVTVEEEGIFSASDPSSPVHPESGSASVIHEQQMQEKQIDI